MATKKTTTKKTTTKKAAKKAAKRTTTKKATAKKAGKKKAKAASQPKDERQDDRFYFEPIDKVCSQVRKGNKRIGVMMHDAKLGYRPKSDRRKADKMEWFKTKEECAKRLEKINEARRIYLTWENGWRGLTEKEQAKYKWVQSLFSYM